ncbi:MAG TPA: NAD(P)-dependent oxidoreductase [Candidatus Lokiarchaeia archaeon]|nr:NAD(P)-dependent oxidoreductase [Candidatus Lokiarchaeia archaeon]
MDKKVGLIGIGLVGTALTRVLLAQNFTVVGFDVDPDRQAAFEVLGGTSVQSPAEVAASVPRVILSLPTSAIVRQVIECPDGLLTATPLPEILIDTTTGDPTEVEAMGTYLLEHSIQYLDSPISGSSKEIASRESAFIVGGDQASFEACSDIFAALSDNILYVSETPSMGTRAKLAVNLVLGLNRLALAEGLVFAERLGLDPARALEIFSKTAAHSRALEMKGSQMVTGDFRSYGRLAQHRKDVGIMLAAARELGVKLPLTEVHYRVLGDAVDAGDGELDNSAIIRQVRRMQDRTAITHRWIPPCPN